MLTLFIVACVAEPDVAPAPAETGAPAVAAPITTSPVVGSQSVETPPAAESPSVIVDFWESAQSGWVFVLDTNGLENQSQVLLVDPEAGEVRGRLITGFHPYLALSPDGESLYVASVRPGTLAAVDTSDGSIRWASEVTPPQTHVPIRFPFLAVSSDGRRVYVEAYLPTAARRFAVFDAATGEQVHEERLPGDCGLRGLFSGIDGSGVLALCGNSRIYRLAEADGLLVASPLAIDIPTIDHFWAYPIAGFPFAVNVAVGGEIAYVSTYDGRVATVDLVAEAVSRTVDLDFPDGKIVPFVFPVLSPDGSRLYLPVQLDHSCDCWGRGKAQAIEVVDTSSGAVLGTITPSTLVSALAVSADGRRLYLVDIDGGPLLVIDTVTLEEVGSVELEATTPATLRVMP